MYIEHSSVQYVHRAGTPGDSQSADWIDCRVRNMVTCANAEAGQVTLASIAE